MIRAVLPLALALHASAELAVSHTNDCALTDEESTKPRYLKFCQDYNGDACCLPGHDLEDQIQFELLIDGLGPGCKNPMMYPNIRYFYCLGCDPKQPEYTVYNPDYGSEEAGANDPDSPGTIYVCEDFVKKLWTDYIPQYKECGVMQPNKCPDGFDDFDPYTCGDDLVIPPVVFGEQLKGGECGGPWDGWDPTLCGGEGFMNQYAPPGLGDYSFAVANSTQPCWMPPFMRSSATRVSAGAATMAAMLLGLALRHVLL